jgi:hypothetical protein
MADRFCDISNHPINMKDVQEEEHKAYPFRDTPKYFELLREIHNKTAECGDKNDVSNLCEVVKQWVAFMRRPEILEPDVRVELSPLLEKLAGGRNLHEKFGGPCFS